jgi:glycerol-3-phosphate dehydrogenase
VTAVTDALDALDALDAHRRRQDLEALAGGEVVDVLVVGGGVTGAGVALDAASRGLSVALVERRDLAWGTSRFSSKLVHGGLRYIAHGDIAVAFDSARERHLLMTAIAPHLVRPLPFVIPFGLGLAPAMAALTQAGIGVGDGLRLASRTRGRLLPRGRRIGAAETRALAPAVGPTCRGALLHFDGQLEDDARLVTAIARTAAAHGARIITRCAATALSADGAVLRDELTGETLTIAARQVVVATGVWAGELVDGVRLRPSRGSHIVLRAEALGSPRAATTVLVPGTRSRWVFAIPQPDGTVIVGLTDDEVDGPVPDVAEPTVEDELFLLESLSAGLGCTIPPDQVVGRYAGLRPLLAGEGATSDLSRRHVLLDRDGVLVLTGGKLTTYRRMAKDAVDRVASTLGRGGECRTASLPLVGAGPVDGHPPARLVRRYGAEAANVAAVGSLEPIAAGVPALRCEVEWAVRQEGALTADDVLDRRLRLDLVEEWRAAARPYVEEAVDALTAAR